MLVILVEFAGTDTFTWNPGDTWDPLGIADPNEGVYDGDGNLVRRLLQHHHPDQDLHLYRPAAQRDPTAALGGRPLRRLDLDADFSPDWFEAFMFGDGVVFDYTRRTARWSTRTSPGKSVKDYFLDMSGGEYEIAGDVIGWVQVPHSTWYYGADECPGAALGGSSSSASDGASPAPAAPRSWSGMRWMPSTLQLSRASTGPTTTWTAMASSTACGSSTPATARKTAPSCSTARTTASPPSGRTRRA